MQPRWTSIYSQYKLSLHSSLASVSQIAPGATQLAKLGYIDNDPAQVGKGHQPINSAAYTYPVVHSLTCQVPATTWCHPILHHSLPDYVWPCCLHSPQVLFGYLYSQSLIGIARKATRISLTLNQAHAFIVDQGIQLV